MYGHILIPSDGSELSDRAFAHGLALAKLTGDDIIVLRVTAPPAPILIEGMVIAYPPQEAVQQVEAEVEESFSKLGEQANAAGVACSFRQVEHDQPWRAIVDMAEKVDAGLIVMASHGRRGVSAMVLGSATQKVLTHVKMPVLVCR
jgi:nucleotide-binding universal stress UspA family protein